MSLNRSYNNSFIVSKSTIINMKYVKYVKYVRQERRKNITTYIFEVCIEGKKKLLEMRDIKFTHDPTDYTDYF